MKNFINELLFDPIDRSNVDFSRIRPLPTEINVHSNL